jgi:hypothetical protein
MAAPQALLQRLWVPNPSTSRDLGILVDQPAESVDPQDRYIAR